MVKILVIEDEISVRENLVDLLEAEDHEVVCAENGFLGLLWAFEKLPDLIICDVMMPRIDGHEVLRALRQDPLTADIPYIFLTALSDKTDIRQGMELGADDYLTKPYTRSELLGAVSIRLERQAALKKVKNDLQILPQIQDDVGRVIAKIEVAISLLKTLETEEQRDCCLSILKDTCSQDLQMIQELGYTLEISTQV